MAMFNSRWFPLTICAIVAVASADAKAAEPSAAAVDIRDDAGRVLIAADRIVSYDWPTHTLTLAPGERAKLVAEFHKNTQLVRGIPFTINVGGKPIYAGKITSLLSSLSLSTPTIVIDQKIVEPKLSDDQLRIQLGYPTRQFFQGEDPRGNPQLRTATARRRQAGKSAARKQAVDRRRASRNAIDQTRHDACPTAASFRNRRRPRYPNAVPVRLSRLSQYQSQRTIRSRRRSRQRIDRRPR